MRPRYVYKILQLSEWRTLNNDGQFTGSPVDIADGFIHMSARDHVQATLDKHYTSGADVIMAEIDTVGFGESLIYEVSRGGAEFPHLYTPMPLASVARHWTLTANKNGRYEADAILAGQK